MMLAIVLQESVSDHPNGITVKENAGYHLKGGRTRGKIRTG
jgi:hypothetical protein